MYATIDDLIARFDAPDNPELTQLTGRTGENGPDLERLDTALMEASGEMDIAIGSRHQLPLDGLGESETAHLTQRCCDIARYRLWADQASEEVRRRYDDARDFLARIGDGRLRLGRTSGEAATLARATITSTTRAMTRTTLGGIF